MRAQGSNWKVYLAVAGVVVALVILVIVVWPHLRGAAMVPVEQMPEPPLPSDPKTAELVIRDRAMADKMAGMDEETCRKRHEARMKQLEEMRRKAESR